LCSDDHGYGAPTPKPAPAPIPASSYGSNEGDNGEEEEKEEGADDYGAPAPNLAPVPVPIPAPVYPSPTPVPPPSSEDCETNETPDYSAPSPVSGDYDTKFSKVSIPHKYTETRPSYTSKMVTRPAVESIVEVTEIKEDSNIMPSKSSSPSLESYESTTISNKKAIAPIKPNGRQLPSHG
jgi:hypothetical protein